MKRKFFFVFVPIILFELSIILFMGSILLLTQRDQQTSKNPKNINSTSRFKIPSGYRINTFARLYSAPRDITFSPDGTLLTSLPEKGLIVALPDKDKNGTSENIYTVINGLVNPHGIAFYENKLYIAEFDRVVRYNWDEKTYKATNGEIIVRLPSFRGHINRSISFNKQGQLFISVGSSCNACIEDDNRLGTIMTTDKDGNNLRIYAAGLRNSPFLAVNPLTQALWATEMGQDRLGDNLPPDEINIIDDNKNYGWPYCYGNNIHDNSSDPQNIYTCDNTLAPTYEIPAHSAPLGLAFINSTQFPKNWQNDLLVAYHGSWDRIPPVGYKIIHLKIKNNKIINQNDFITGFIPKDAKSRKEALGRPVDLAFDQSGDLYISDDHKKIIYRVVKK